jgi:D-sedoheptulose 7-phosphate isomerase
VKFIEEYYETVIKTVEGLDQSQIAKCVNFLREIRMQKGRVFVLGMGGSAGNASHMVNDLRKICNIEAYAPTDNVSEFSASCNDEGLGSYFPRWLETSKITSNDAIFILSVGGGNRELNVSTELTNAIDVAVARGTRILGIVGRDGGYSQKKSKDVILVPSIISELDTALVESFQAIIWHGIVFHPDLKMHPSKWESVMNTK